MLEEGGWSTGRYILGFVVSTSALAIRLPEPKIACDRVLMETALQNIDTQFLTVNLARQLRGNFEHFKATNSMRKNLCGSVDALLSYVDEQNFRIFLPVPQIWKNFRGAIRINLSVFQPESRRRALFAGELVR